jgi:hypothetical protein
VLGTATAGWDGSAKPKLSVAHVLYFASGFVPVEWLNSYSDVTVHPGHGYEDVMRQLTGVDGHWSRPYEVANDGFVW